MVEWKDLRAEKFDEIGDQRRGRFLRSRSVLYGIERVGESGKRIIGRRLGAPISRAVSTSVIWIQRRVSSL